MDAERAKETLERFRARNPEAVRLATHVSLATRIEAGLLRATRLRLSPPLDASHEADLWFSPLVESWSARAFVLHPAVARQLQAELWKDEEQALGAWRLVERLHANGPSIVALEERVTWLALSQGPRALAQIEEELQRTLRTMVQDEDQASGVARWALSALTRFPDWVRETATARLLTFGAAARLGPRALVGVPRANSLPEDARWLFPERYWLAQQVIRLERTAAGITFLQPTAESLTRGHRLEVPATQPLLLEVSWGHGEREAHQVVIPEPGRFIPVPADETSVWLRTVTGDEFELTSASDRPSNQIPRDLDPEVWRSCAWIHTLEQGSVSYFITPRILASAATPFAAVPLGTAFRATYEGQSREVTLLELSLRDGVALFELLDEARGVKPLNTRFPISHDPSEDELRFEGSGIAHWIAYGLSQEASEWAEGFIDFSQGPRRQPSPSTPGGAPLRIPAFQSRREPMTGAPVVVDGMWFGHVVGMQGFEAEVCPAYTVMKALARTRLADEPDLAEIAAEEWHRNQMWDLILGERTFVEGEISEGVERLLGRHRQITSDLLPSADETGTMTGYGDAVITLHKESLDIEGGGSALFTATVDFDETYITLYVDKSTYAVWDDDDSRFSITDADWNDHTMEVECIASIRVIATVQVDTESSDVDILNIASAAVISIEDDEIELLRIHESVRSEPSDDDMPDPHPETFWSLSTQSLAHVLTATIRTTSQPDVFLVRIQAVPLSNIPFLERPLDFRMSAGERGILTLEVPPADGVVDFEVESSGAFVVEVRIDRELLQLDLTTARDAPEGFRKRLALPVLTETSSRQWTSLSRKPGPPKASAGPRRKKVTKPSS
ncbi:hypothetical protein D7X32_32915 [Corallococcus carmarthensis]|uniref:Uncharacterized protein n=2 Tax=Corallococcus carmarthensis TaxID=2316728 RepID=A0A3A8JNT6_9BACT|nr:hypothetical protein D7X32_32915 [Corallococcus carmarthensis]